MVITEQMEETMNQQSPDALARRNAILARLGKCGIYRNYYVAQRKTRMVADRPRIGPALARLLDLRE